MFPHNSILERFAFLTVENVVLSQRSNPERTTFMFGEQLITLVVLLLRSVKAFALSLRNYQLCLILLNGHKAVLMVHGQPKPPPIPQVLKE